MDTPNPLQIVNGLVAAFTSGPHTLTLLAEDRAGNASQAEVTFTVYPVEWLPPLGNSEPYSAEAGRTIPVKFKVYDLAGAVVIDNSVELRLLDAAGNIVGGPFSLSSNPNQGVAVLDDGQYLHNLSTAGLQPGTSSWRIQTGNQASWRFDPKAL